MKEIKYPFDDSIFNEYKKVYIDANIFINYSFEDEESGIYIKCDKVLEQLKKNNVKIFVSNIVISEVINKVLYRLFQNDMCFKCDEDMETVAREKDILKIIDNLNKCKYFNINIFDENNLEKTDFISAFNYINKNKYFRTLLKPYFDKTIEMINQYREFLNFSYLEITTEIYMKSLENFQCQMLGINDAQHLQIAIDYKMNYLLTTDKDFAFVAQSFKTEILKI